MLCRNRAPAGAQNKKSGIVPAHPAYIAPGTVTQEPSPAVIIPDFKKIVPNDYQRMLTAIGRHEEQGVDHEHAVLEAFKEVAM